MTPQELIAKWRSKAMEIINRIGPDPAQKNVSWERQAVALQIQADADELAFTLAATTCATCRFRRTPLDRNLVFYECAVLAAVIPLRMDDQGKSFSCSAWAASPPLEKGRE